MHIVTVEDEARRGQDLWFYWVGCDQCGKPIDVVIPRGAHLPLDRPGEVTLDTETLESQDLCIECIFARLSADDRAELTPAIDRLRATRSRLDIADARTVYAMAGIPRPDHPRLKDALVSIVFCLSLIHI